MRGSASGTGIPLLPVSSTPLQELWQAGCLTYSRPAG